MRCFIVILLSLIPLIYGKFLFSYLANWSINDQVINFFLRIDSSAKPPTRGDRMRHIPDWGKFIIGGVEVQDFSQFAYQLSMRVVEVCLKTVFHRQFSCTD
jgi:hypothetical protein